MVSTIESGYVVFFSMEFAIERFHIEEDIMSAIVAIRVVLSVLLYVPFSIECAIVDRDWFVMPSFYRTARSMIQWIRLKN